MFPAFVKNIGSLVNNFFQVKMFDPFTSFTSSSLSSIGAMWDKSTDNFLSDDSF